ncbi:hypothetical protein CFP56_044046 [Quercus suber]|uniref:Uncharacterized protein n=1 Tax=Quercus suber TaxID=58331 RepID=A0AAW0LGF6_QUESU
MANFRSSPTKAFASLKWEPKGRQLIIQRGGAYIWKSGVLRVNQFENVSPDITSRYDFNVVSNEDEQSFCFNYKNQSQQGTWGLTFMGQLLDSSDAGEQTIARADNCYGNNNDGGCQRLKSYSQSVGIMVTQLNLKVAFHGRIQICITFQIQNFPLVTVKLLAGATVAVWLFIFCTKMQQGATFGQIFRATIQANRQVHIIFMLYRQSLLRAIRR